jgi:hypothetical protein
MPEIIFAIVIVACIATVIAGRRSETTRDAARRARVTSPRDRHTVFTGTLTSASLPNVFASKPHAAGA